MILCAYCQTRRGYTKDHVIPRALLRRYNRTAPLEAPSIPPKWLDTVPCCLECNVRKATRRLVPPSWERQVTALNRFFPGVPWRVWHGDVSEPAFAQVHR